MLQQEGERERGEREQKERIFKKRRKSIKLIRLCLAGHIELLCGIISIEFRGLEK
jgi:hypothetical protein